jgi:hypothetical protein
MSTVLQKHSRVPRKANPDAKPPQRQYSVAKRPMGDLTQEDRSNIAREVLEGYMQGKQVADMSGKYGVSDVTIYALLLREHEEAWVDIQKARALARMERAINELEVAPDALSLARAREKVRSAQWELERLIRRLYGQDREINVNVTVGDLGDRLRRARERVIDATSAVQHDLSALPDTTEKRG